MLSRLHRMAFLDSKKDGGTAVEWRWCGPAAAGFTPPRRIFLFFEGKVKCVITWAGGLILISKRWSMTRATTWLLQAQVDSMRGFTGPGGRAIQSINFPCKDMPFLHSGWPACLPLEASLTPSLRRYRQYSPRFCENILLYASQKS